MLVIFIQVGMTTTSVSAAVSSITIELFNDATGTLPYSPDCMVTRSHGTI